MSHLTCDHCLLTFPEKEAVSCEVGGQVKVFCCIGCRGIYRLIHEQGLDEFYERRTGWQPGPPEDREVSPGPFLDSVRTLENQQSEIDVNLSGIRCSSCIWLIEHYLKKVQGIVDIRVNYATHRARIQWLPEDITLGAILQRIKALGYIPRPHIPSDRERHLREEKKDLLVRFGTASFFSMQLMLYTTALYAGYFQGIDPFHKRVFQYIAWALATPVMFYCGYPFLKNTVSGIRNTVFTMDTLVFAGSFSAYLYSIIAIFTSGEVYFDTSAMIITLILLGRYMESGAKVKATGALSSLIGLQPAEARLIPQLPMKENLPVTVPIASLKSGDTIEVIPGERIPVDCIVKEGTSEVNESMLTGESMPVRKSGGAEVWGGTLNLNGRLVLIVQSVGEDTVLARIVKAVEDAQARRAPIQKIADRVVRWFVPAIGFISIATLLFWLTRGQTPSVSLMHAISVLVIACPCALGLATPLAILISSTILSSRGILVKGGDVIETLAQTDFIFFDKTGTLTTGMASLSTMVSYGRDTGRDLQVLAASLEKNSEHSIAKALRRDIPEDELYPVEDFCAHPGKGVEGVIHGKRVAAGNPAFLTSRGLTITNSQMHDFHKLTSGGKTVIGLGMEGTLTCWFAVSDNLRQEAAGAVDSLKKTKCHVHLLTGDHRSVAEEIGKKAGIRMIEAGVLPVQKAEIIRQKRESGCKVAMVGDGINDAPALIEADAGIAMGGATDIALESADVVLMRNDLRLLPQLIRVSRRTLSVIRENLFWAFSYNLIAIPLAVSGRIHPILSAAFMVMSSLMVISNSLRLHRIKKPPEA